MEDTAMAKTTVTVSLDEMLVSRARAAGDLSAVVEDALRRRLDCGAADKTADQRWAEDNALAVEALAGGAEEARER
jgi:post-segregation antitoxin (ccd killing protein)